MVYLGQVMGVATSSLLITSTILTADHESVGTWTLAMLIQFLSGL